MGCDSLYHLKINRFSDSVLVFNELMSLEASVLLVSDSGPIEADYLPDVYAANNEVLFQKAFQKRHVALESLLALTNKAVEKVDAW
nr:MAG: hypothetical protein AM324_02935 [Candidatus Thorarchaeota archaeon SMTZ1-83]